jgi:hypothetical protein
LRIWRKNHEFDLEGELRSNRPKPSPELLYTIEDRLRTPEPRTRARIRAALAVVLTIGLLAALMPVGALGYASHAISSAARTAAKITHVSTKPTRSHSSAAAQYPKPKKKKKKKCPKGTKRNKKGKCVKVRAARRARGPRFTG